MRWIELRKSRLPMSSLQVAGTGGAASALVLPRETQMDWGRGPHKHSARASRPGHLEPRDAFVRHCGGATSWRQNRAGPASGQGRRWRRGQHRAPARTSSVESPTATTRARAILPTWTSSARHPSRASNHGPAPPWPFTRVNELSSPLEPARAGDEPWVRPQTPSANMHFAQLPKCRRDIRPPRKGASPARAVARVGRDRRVLAQSPRGPARAAGRRGRQAGAPSTWSRAAGCAQSRLAIRHFFGKLSKLDADLT